MKKTIVRTLSTAALLSIAYAGSAHAATYKVQKGDTLSEIASKYNTSVAQIKKLNSLKSDLIHINQTLQVSTAVKTTHASKSATYTVVKGDALIKIANRFDVTVGELKQWNKLASDMIYVGQVLKVSDGASTSFTTQTVKPAAKPSAKPAVPAKPAASTATTFYTVKSGDYLGKIAKTYNTTVANLKSLNGLKSDFIRVGDKLKVPAKTAVKPAVKPATKPVSKPVLQAPAKPAAPAIKPQATGYYLVVGGDTLGKIAVKFGTTIQDLKSQNNLTSDLIYVGQQLKVPSQAGATVTKPTQTVNKPAAEPSDADLSQKAISIAKDLIGVPYVWGGNTPDGFDCSGFIYYVYKNSGKSLLRTSAAGYYARAYYVDKPKPGDLVFFENTYKKGISHLGIYLGNNQFIHASDYGVAISNLDNPYYKSHFESFKRFY
nr:peptidoglycan endopeptidase [Neobacillus mesonae]